MQKTKVTEQPEEKAEPSFATLTAHLGELKKRVIYALLVWAAASIAAYLWSEEIFGALTLPLKEAFSGEEGRKLIYTGMAEAFLTYIRLAIFTGFAVSFPFIAIQTYLFIAPGLYSQEKQAVKPFFAASPALFYVGALFAYFFIMPMAWKFFAGFQTPGGGGHLPVTLEARVSEYLSLSMQLLTVFGLAFQLPVVLAVLARLGIVDSKMLASKRRHAVVAIVVVAAFITPPDVLSQIALSIPLYLLYELSILTCRNIQQRK